MASCPTAKTKAGIIKRGEKKHDSCHVANIKTARESGASDLIAGINTMLLNGMVGSR